MSRHRICLTGYTCRKPQTPNPGREQYATTFRIGHMHLPPRATGRARLVETRAVGPGLRSKRHQNDRRALRSRSSRDRLGCRRLLTQPHNSGLVRDSERLLDEWRTVPSLLWPDARAHKITTRSAAHVTRPAGVNEGIGAASSRPTTNAKSSVSWPKHQHAPASRSEKTAASPPRPV